MSCDGLNKAMGDVVIPKGKNYRIMVPHALVQRCEGPYILYRDWDSNPFYRMGWNKTKSRRAG
jgi:hypothetical protein